MSSLVAIRHHTEVHDLAVALGLSNAELAALGHFLRTASDEEVEKKRHELEQKLAARQQPQ